MDFVAVFYSLGVAIITNSFGYGQFGNGFDCRSNWYRSGGRRCDWCERGEDRGGNAGSGLSDGNSGAGVVNVRFVGVVVLVTVVVVVIVVVVVGESIVLVVSVKLVLILLGEILPWIKLRANSCQHTGKHDHLNLEKKIISSTENRVSLMKNIMNNV